MSAIALTRIASQSNWHWPRRLLIPILILLLLGALGGAFIRLKQNLAAGYLKIELESERIALDLDRELELQAYSVAALGALADSVLTGRLRLQETPVTRLVPALGRSGYTAELTTALGPVEHHGNITGLGPIPARESLAAREMTMAVSLTPMMRSIKNKSPEIPWLYYQSAQDFIYLYPRVPAERFFYSRQLQEKEHYRSGLPQYNPQGAIYWTGIYEDSAGLGKMVSVNRPVYLDQRFLGVLSIDISVKTLMRHVLGHRIDHSRIYLYDAQGRAMINPDEQAPALDAQSLPAGEPVIRDGRRLMRHAIPSAQWQLVVATDHRAMQGDALIRTGLHLVTALLLVLSLSLIFLLTRSLRRIRVLSVRDGLTGLYNRRHFDEVASVELARCKRHRLHLGLMLIDVDYFKKYNDHYGHQQGDVALQEVAGVMRSTLRRATDGLFRVGGEEFAVLVELETASELPMLAGRLNDAVRALGMPHVHGPHGLLTVSIGMTLLGPDEWVDMETAYRQADEALYEAKHLGRDRAVTHAFAPELPVKDSDPCSTS